MKHPEQRLQEWFSLWLASKGLLFCSSAGGMRTSMGTAKKMKRAGYKRGFPDVFIYEPRNGYHGMAIELKVKSKPDKEGFQIEWQKRLLANGYYSIIVPHDLDYQQVQIYLESEVNLYLAAPDNRGMENAIPGASSRAAHKRKGR